MCDNNLTKCIICNKKVPNLSEHLQSSKRCSNKTREIETITQDNTIAIESNDAEQTSQNNSSNAIRKNKKKRDKKRLQNGKETKINIELDSSDDSGFYSDDDDNNTPCAPPLPNDMTTVRFNKDGLQMFRK